MKPLHFLSFAAVTISLSSSLFAQIALVHNPRLPGPAPTTEFRISGVEINADINEQVATVQIAQTFHNIGSRVLETQFLFPMPEGAAINGLTLIVDGKELPGELKPKDEARREYEEIVRRQKDPALLEYMGRGLFQTSVFPIPPGQQRRVEIRYTQLLTSDSGLVDFTLPLGTTKHSDKAVEKVNVNVRIESKDELKNVYSPTHDFEIDRPNENRATCRLTMTDVREPDDVRLLYGTKGNDVGISLVTYKPDGDEQGYFLMLATPRVKAEKDAVISKTVLFVVDKSGSMAGEKLKQAKASLKYMINSLGPKDTFNIVSYSSEVDLFRPELELVTEESKKAALLYAEDIFSGGGTNISGALRAALEQLKDKDQPNYVMFMTDGLPTVGVTDETEIAAIAKKANQAKARVFNFGVGYDVNSRLLDRLSRDQRGTSVYVKPEEDIEVAATNMFRKISSPAMTGLKLRFVKESESDSDSFVNRMIPGDLPDLFRGEQLIVVGRYKKPMPITIDLTGNVGGKSRTLTHESHFGNASDTRRNGFVETLWATRRIGEIINDLDLNGQNKELVDELVALSLKHGIMTPYTSFLADENVSFGDRPRLTMEAESRTQDGLSIAGGGGGFVQREFKQSLQNAGRGASSLSSGLGGSAPAADSFSPFGGGHPLPAASRKSGFALSRDKNAPSAVGGVTTAPAASIVPVDATEKSDDSRTDRSRIKRIGNKTFYWKNNEWQDSALSDEKQEIDEKKVIRVEQFSNEYFELSSLDEGRWSAFLSVTEPLLVQIGERVYRIVPPPEVKSGE